MAMPPNAGGPPEGSDPQGPEGEGPAFPPPGDSSHGPPQAPMPYPPPPGAYPGQPQGPPPPTANYPGWQAQGPPPRRGRTGLIVALAIIAAVVLIGALGAIGYNALRDTGADIAGESPRPTETTDPETTDPETTDAEPTGPPVGGPGPTIFGGTVSYEDGLSVTVDPPEEFTPSAWAFYDEAEAYARVTITVTNDGTESFDLLWFTVSAQSGQREASSVYDSDEGLEGTPYTSLLPGRSLSWDEGFGVDDPDDLVLYISPSLDHEEAVFVSG